MPRALEQAFDGLAQIRRIVTAMKDYSYQGKGKREMADLNMTLETALVISRNEWKRWAEIHREFDPQLPLVPWYIGEIKQVF
jgi:nitrogen-specific signal transduction histidine kinase